MTSQYTQKYTRKNIKLSLELDDYLAKHPDVYEQIPDGALVAITHKNDRKFTRDSISIAKRHRKEQPIIQAEKEKSGWSLSLIN